MTTSKQNLLKALEAAKEGSNAFEVLQAQIDLIAAYLSKAK